MQVIPLQAVAQQSVRVTLGQQSCLIRVCARSTGVFVDVYVNDVLVIAGVRCTNKNRIVRSAYLGFSGDLAFVDTQGTSDPDYTGFGDRYVLMYYSASDL